MASDDAAAALLVGADALLRDIGDPLLRLLDCRFDLTDPEAGRHLYERGHLPGAVYADLERDLSGPVDDASGRHPLPRPDVLAASFRRLGIGSATRVVVYDDAGGAIAARAWWLLRWLGHDDAAVLNGGLAAWERAGGTLESGAITPEPGDFRGESAPGRVLTTQELLARPPGDVGPCLVDARDEARYLGRVEPLDAVAGHVPGALNLPFRDALDADGLWKPVAELRALWSGVLGEHSDRPCAVMCGSGVTACHLVLSALLAGCPEPRLYAGSWSEWIRDPARPVATGAEPRD